MAKFQINDTLSLLGRGYVLTGDIIEGEISPGDVVYVVLNKGLTQSTIKSVEYADWVTEKIVQIALIIEPFGTDDYKDQLKGQIIDVLDK
ncbi:MAG: hypothetical protein JO080_05350 [Mucilaginibacter sp.]|nr:hypothetical protein [Mucilaginibacter sp.]